MIVFPLAKINIGLRITGKRSDGYHDIETIFYPIGLSDALEFVISDDQVNRDTIVVTGRNTGSGSEDNIVIKAVQRLHENYSFPYLKIHLHKVIPIGAGLGGGSSDASYILKAINKSFSLLIDENSLKSTALEMGSDCPFFIDVIPSYATGRGEKLFSVRSVLSGLYLILLNPGVEINTREAYQNCNPEQPSTSLFQLINRPVTEWKDLIVNDFETFACKKHPIICDIKNGLYESGTIFSLMSGSGSSVYGIYEIKTAIPDKLKKFVVWEGIM
jgi:4-diphosphocytidyl-2-C-methyl-D-erythritol kinase